MERQQPKLVLEKLNSHSQDAEMLQPYKIGFENESKASNQISVQSKKSQYQASITNKRDIKTMRKLLGKRRSS